jgi:hypothetical protein
MGSQTLRHGVAGGRATGDSQGKSFTGNEKFGSRKETLANIEKVRNSIFNDTSWEFRLWGDVFAA